MCPTIFLQHNNDPNHTARVLSEKCLCQQKEQEVLQQVVWADRALISTSWSQSGIT